MATGDTSTQSGVMDRLTPYNAAAGSFAAWTFVFALAPIDPRWSENISGYLLILLGVAGLLLGAKLPEASGLKPAHVAISETACRRALTICVALGFLGLAFKVYDTLFLRNVDFTQNTAVAREQLGRGETSVMSVIAAALLPFGNAALLLGWLARQQGIIKNISVSAWLVAAAPGVFSVLVGSRSSLLIFAFLILAAYLNLAPRINLWRVVVIALAGVGAVSIFATIFVSRVEVSGMTMLMAARYSAYTQVVPLQPWAMAVIDEGGEFGPLIAGYASILQYFTSGIFEFLYLVELKQGDFAGGSYTLFFIPKVLGLITGGGFEARLADMSNEILNPRTGVFQTFFGPLYIDFGYFLPIACGVFGAIAGFLRLAVLRGNIFAFPLYVFMLMQLMLAASLPSLSMNAAILSNVALGLLYFVGNWCLTRCGEDAGATAAAPRVVAVKAGRPGRA